MTAMPVSDSLVKDAPPLTEMLWAAPPNPLAYSVPVAVPLAQTESV